MRSHLIAENYRPVLAPGELMANGKSVARVADLLGCSYHTVHHHARNIYRKLNVHNRSELVRKAAAAGLLADR
jgi:DNA-binding CsgD family transcriptional regulator